MTTVYVSDLTARDPKAVGTHVVIVGVGEYPSLLGGTGELLENPMNLKQLSSPPVSAAALATWFLGREGPAPAAVGFQNPNAPLATVEMLLSPSQTYTRPDGTQVAVDAATRANIAQGFARWKERAAAHADNVAVFYFCGHGVMGANDYLLPADFGHLNRDNPWADAIDIAETARAMRRLAGGPLYFLVDACRQAARDALSPGASPPALAYVDFKKPVQGFTKLILWATGEGQEAFGAPNQPSRFTAALIEALSGYEAEPASGDQGWMVTGDLLQRSVSAILEAGNAPLERAKHQHVERQLIGSQPLHFESTPPRRIVTGIPSRWSVGPEVRQLLGALGVGETLPAKALDVLAEQLEARKLQVETLQTEIQGWTQRYRELEQQLRGEPDSGSARQAQELLQAGKLEEAGRVLDRLIEAGEERLAFHYLSRGRIFELQFKPLEALNCYEKAYTRRPDDPEIALAYAVLLHGQRDYGRAKPVYLQALATYRELAQANPAAFQPAVATTLNNLGNVHREEHRYAEARNAYGEALTIHRGLAQANPAAYQPDVAMTLSNLGIVHAEEHRYAEARNAFGEALAIRRGLVQANPAAYQPDVATTLNNLGVLHLEEHRYAEARNAYGEALAIFRELAQTNPAAFQPDVAMTLNNLGVLHAEEHHYAEARNAYGEALAIRRELAQANPAAYQPAVATTLSNLGVVHAEEHRYAEALNAYGEALAIRRGLAQANPAAYQPDVAMTLSNLGIVHQEEHRYADARSAYGEALAIHRELAQANPAAFQPDVAMTLNNLGVLHREEHRYAEALNAYGEALAIRRGLAQANPAAYQPAVATTLSNLGIVHAEEHRYADALNAYGEALAIRRGLAQANPVAYQPDVARTLNNLGVLHREEHRYAEALKAYGEALRIYEEFAATSPETFGPDVERLRTLIREVPENERGRRPRAPGSKKRHTKPKAG